MPEALTLMAVHAHPDDEVISTGGILARYGAEGVRTVLVTCTNGEQGDGPGGVKPGQPGHDEASVTEVRLSELRKSCEVLGVTSLELLGYHDSGMVGWAANETAGSFANIDVDDAADRVAGLIERYRPQVVVTYDDNGGYGHPDHIQTHRVTIRAVAKSTLPLKLYETAVPRSGLSQLATLLADAGVEEPFEPPSEDFGTPDELITTSIDVSGYLRQKFDALAAHTSQVQEFFLLRLPETVRDQIFGREWFVRRTSPVEVSGHETDLFAGLR